MESNAKCTLAKKIKGAFFNHWTLNYFLNCEPWITHNNFNIVAVLLIHMMYLCPIDIALFIVITGRRPSDDIGNALLVNDRCYWMIKEHLNFTDAHRRCQEKGWILAEIPDKEAQTAVERSDETLLDILRKHFFSFFSLIFFLWSHIWRLWASSTQAQSQLKTFCEVF